MLYFRLYFFSPRSGHIVRFAEFEAPDETAAVALAESNPDGRPMELWCRHRKVATFDGAAA